MIMHQLSEILSFNNDQKILHFASILLISANSFRSGETGYGSSHPLPTLIRTVILISVS